MTIFTSIKKCFIERSPESKLKSALASGHSGPTFRDLEQITDFTYNSRHLTTITHILSQNLYFSSGKGLLGSGTRSPLNFDKGKSDSEADHLKLLKALDITLWLLKYGSNEFSNWLLVNHRRYTLPILKMAPGSKYYEDIIRKAETLADACANLSNLRLYRQPTYN